MMKRKLSNVLNSAIIALVLFMGAEIEATDGIGDSGISSSLSLLGEGVPPPPPIQGGNVPPPPPLEGVPSAPGIPVAPTLGSIPTAPALGGIPTAPRVVSGLQAPKAKPAWKIQQEAREAAARIKAENEKRARDAQQEANVAACAEFQELKAILEGAEECLVQDGAAIQLDKSQPAELQPLMVVGDLHGDLLSLEVCLTKFKEFAELELAKGKKANLLFLGDYVDRGPNSIEIIKILAKLKRAYPKRIFLLRGNHETLRDPMEQSYGLAPECYVLFPTIEKSIGEHRYTPVQDLLTEFFNYLPLYAKGGRYRFMHAYVPMRIERVGGEKKAVGVYSSSEVEKHLGGEKLPYPIRDDWGIDYQLVWNDPDASTTLSDTVFGSPRYKVPSPWIEQFASDAVIVRAHEVEKYNKYLPGRKIYNIFSSYFAFALTGSNFTSAENNKEVELDMRFISCGTKKSSNPEPVASILKISDLTDDNPVINELTSSDIKQASSTIASHFGFEPLSRIYKTLDHDYKDYMTFWRGKESDAYLKKTDSQTERDIKATIDALKASVEKKDAIQKDWVTELQAVFAVSDPRTASATASHFQG